MPKYFKKIKKYEEKAMKEKLIQDVMKILNYWNPLGTAAKSVNDLDNYRTEAIDILFNIGLEQPNPHILTIIKEVINEAFDLSLSNEDCTDAAKLISDLINKDKI